jgi:hypothetical protein
MDVKITNWDCGRAIPFLGIFVLNFRHWYFAVYTDGGHSSPYQLMLKNQIFLLLIEPKIPVFLSIGLLQILES